MQPFPSMLLSLSDNQIGIIMAAASPLQPDERSKFFEAVAVRLVSVPVLGDGSVARICRETQRAFFDPPQFTRDTKAG
jgi:hypothetical protein